MTVGKVASLSVVPKQGLSFRRLLLRFHPLCVGLNFNIYFSLLVTLKFMLPSNVSSSVLLRKVRGHRLTHLKNVIGHGDTIKISKKVKKTSLGAPRDRAEPCFVGSELVFLVFWGFW